MHQRCYKMKFNETKLDAQGVPSVFNLIFIFTHKLVFKLILVQGSVAPCNSSLSQPKKFIKISIRSSTMRVFSN